MKSSLQNSFDEPVSVCLPGQSHQESGARYDVNRGLNLLGKIEVAGVPEEADAGHDWWGN